MPELRQQLEISWAGAGLPPFPQRIRSREAGVPPHSGFSGTSGGPCAIGSHAFLSRLIPSLPVSSLCSLLSPPPRRALCLPTICRTRALFWVNPYNCLVFFIFHLFSFRIVLELNPCRRMNISPVTCNLPRISAHVSIPLRLIDSFCGYKTSG